MATAKPRSSKAKVKAWRDRMREKGLRPVQIWIPDTRTPEFAAEARRQSRLVANSPGEAEDMAFLSSLFDEMLADIDRAERDADE